ncbi:MAG TPA: hypothetical protein PKD78_01230, partial [Saprospiraceae bacterium]|nr:hypothetical protein [Saprospiraceae bacterium]
MDQKPYTEEDVEKFVRQALQRHQDSPDDGLWDALEAKQRPLNSALSTRHRVMRAWPVAALAVLALGAWWLLSRPSPAAPAPEPALPPAATSQPIAGGGPEFTFPEKRPPAGLRSGGKRPGAGPADQPWLAQPAARVRFAAEDGFRYENPATGTRVHIPAYALTYADGQSVSGEVDFELREYRSLADFAASGMPMHYVDGRGEFFFNSGGMFDVRVSQRGEALQLAPGQGCDLRFRSTHALTQASLFYFDEARQAWQYQPDPAFGPPADLPPVVTEAVAVRDNLGLAGRGGCLPPATYTLPQKGKEGLWVKEAVQLGHDLAFGKTSVPMWFRKNPGFTNTQFLNGLEHSLVRIVRHRDARENFFPEDMNGVFTELQAFKDCYFICSDSLNRQSFSQADLQAYWERVSVTQERGAVCYVSFYGKQGLLQFYATLVGSTGNDDFNADAVMEEYRRLQTARRNGVEREISRWRQFLSVSPMFQTQEEWCMDASQWFDYVEKNPALMRQRYAGLAQQGLAQHDATAAQAWSEWR